MTPLADMLRAMRGRHAMVSFEDHRQIEEACEVCQSVVLDNGAFSAWRQGKPHDFAGYQGWAASWLRHPCVEWAVIPGYRHHALCSSRNSTSWRPSMSEHKSADHVRELTYEERATWGECPVCHVSHGQRCDGNVGIALGRTVNGGLPTDGVHMGRLRQAPMKVREVPCG